MGDPPCFFARHAAVRRETSDKALTMGPSAIGCAALAACAGTETPENEEIGDDMATDLMIHTKDLTKRYDEYVAVDRISFDVHRGGRGLPRTERRRQVHDDEHPECFISATDGTAKVHGFDV